MAGALLALGVGPDRIWGGEKEIRPSPWTKKGCHLSHADRQPGGGSLVRFVRVGTLDEPASVRPDVHIYTRSRAPWVELPPDVPVFEAFYDVKEVWAKDARRNAVLLQVAARVAQAGDAE